MILISSVLICLRIKGVWIENIEVCDETYPQGFPQQLRRKEKIIR